MRWKLSTGYGMDLFGVSRGKLLSNVSKRRCGIKINDVGMKGK